MRVIVVSFLVRRPYSHAPAAVTVPTAFDHFSALDGDDGRTHAAHNVVTEMSALKAVASRVAEVVVMRKPVPARKRKISRKSVSPVGALAEAATENRLVTIAVIIEIFIFAKRLADRNFFLLKFIGKTDKPFVVALDLKRISVFAS